MSETHNSAAGGRATLSSHYAVSTRIVSHDPYVYGASSTHKGRHAVSRFGGTRSAARRAVVADRSLTCDTCGAYIQLCWCAQ